ncbi:hypothetical protein [Amycolatopsis sp. H20-H5]|uniref:hypothetical protein n=1 Tax=Amycolatopsis sp. H20-H5 TaxID=3046309 RepID=UPI002DBC20E4|nr:hypothetical protein [Amycolatopsis sp. H20-H5]MEC3973726.1 hypothetical protein [Amycolatopsis sp. H20-H5]
MSSTETVETPEGLDEPEEAVEETETPEAAGEPPARGRWKTRLPALLVAGAVVLAGAGAWFTVAASSAASTPASANRALTDVGGTAEVTSAVTLALNKVFSYSYDKTGVTEKAADAVLRGKALDTYHQLFAQVQEKAPQQKLVLTTRVVTSAVQELDGDNARLLVFLDQSATRVDNNSTSTAAAQLSVTAERRSGGWLITDLIPR